MKALRNVLVKELIRIESFIMGVLNVTIINILGRGLQGKRIRFWKSEGFLRIKYKLEIGNRTNI